MEIVRAHKMSMSTAKAKNCKNIFEEKKSSQKQKQKQKQNMSLKSKFICFWQHINLSLFIRFQMIWSRFIAFWRANQSFLFYHSFDHRFYELNPIFFCFHIIIYILKFFKVFTSTLFKLQFEALNFYKFVLETCQPCCFLLFYALLKLHLLTHF